MRMRLSMMNVTIPAGSFRMLAPDLRINCGYSVFKHAIGISR